MEPVVLSDGTTLEHLEDDSTFFLNRSIFIYGPSNTGKTTTATHIMKMLEPYIPKILVVCPSEDSSNSYGKMIPKAAIFKDIDDAWLKSVWEHQDMASNIFNQANNIETMALVYERVRNSRTDALLARIEALYRKMLRRAERVGNPVVRATETEEIRARYDDQRRRVFRLQIAANADDLLQTRLPDEELIVVKFLNYCPRLLLVFDDAANILARYKHSEVFKNLMFQGRHAQVTMMAINHSDKTMAKELRGAAFVSIFCSAEIATNFFARGSGNGSTKETERQVADICRRLWPRGDDGNIARKLVWMRQRSEPFCYMTPARHPAFTFGCQTLHKLCELGERDTGALDKNNRFYSSFIRG